MLCTLTVCVLEGASLTADAAPPKWSDTSFCSCRSGRTAAGTATVVARPASSMNRTRGLDTPVMQIEEMRRCRALPDADTKG